MPLHPPHPLSSEELEFVLRAHSHGLGPGVAPELALQANLALLQTRWARDHVQWLGWAGEGGLRGAFRLQHLEMLINGSKRSCAGVGSLVALGGGRPRDVARALVADVAQWMHGRYWACFMFVGSEVATIRSLGFFAVPNLRFVLSRAGLPHQHGQGHGGATATGTGGPGSPSNPVSASRWRPRRSWRRIFRT